MAGAAFPSLQACSHLATGTGVHRVRQRSDGELVEKSACIESERQHFGHVAEGRDCECRKGGVHQVSKRNVRYVNDAQISSNRGIERYGRRRSSEVPPAQSRRNSRGRFSLVPSCL